MTYRPGMTRPLRLVTLAAAVTLLASPLAADGHEAPRVAIARQFPFSAASSCEGDGTWRLRVRPGDDGPGNFSGEVRIAHVTPGSRWSFGYMLRYTEHGETTILYEHGSARASDKGFFTFGFGGTSSARYHLAFDAHSNGNYCRARSSFRFP